MNTLARSNVSSPAFQDEIAATSSLSSLSSLDSLTSANSLQHRVVVATPTSLRMRNLASRFNEVVSLPEGWDGYTGVPVSFATAQFAAQMVERLCVSDVPTPSVIPGTDGSVQVEWHTGGYDVELDVLGPLEVEGYRLNQATGKVDELEIESDFSQIAQWISDIALARRAVNVDVAAG